MDDFKLKNIDEFDSLFFDGAETGEVPAPQPQAAPAPVFTAPVQPEYQAPVEQPAAPQPTFNGFAPNVGSEPLYTPSSSIGQSVVPESFYDNYPVDGGNEPAKEKVKKSGGALAGKIISIIMLVVTVVVFLFGCFIAVFLNNDGANIGGYTFNTLAESVEGDGLELNKGDLIISKLVEPDEYTTQDYIAVPVGEDTDGCKMVGVVNVIASNKEATLTGRDSDGTDADYSSDNIFGAVQFYIPVIGTVLNFAIDNAVLVCVLFVLLAALWCLILVLIEKSKAKKTK